MLNIALPTGKSLESKTLALLKEAGITITRPHPRQCFGEVAKNELVSSALFCRSAEIPRLIETGVVDVGIMGRDLLREQVQYAALQNCLIRSYSRSTNNQVRGALFVRDTDPICSVTDAIGAIASGEIVITEYSNLVQAYIAIETGGRVQACCDTCAGSTEALVAAGRYRIGATLVETGETLRVNGLREIPDAVIFQSQPALVYKPESFPSGSANVRRFSELRQRLQ